MSILTMVTQNYTNSDIAAAIIQILPQGTYTSVSVNNTSYEFFGVRKEQTRVITLNPTGASVQLLIEKIKRLFFGFEPPANGTTYNTSLLSEYIINNRQSEAAEQQLRQACQEKRTVSIFISLESKNIFCTVQDDRGMCTIQ
jgi:hypothetical protein